ncbi:FAS1 domain-containing protein [Dioscorea alata]|uniref:FAS1 domain-containing protein n=1 Tax=Dioscorea alata TaxID=55571 RepID=A0ACB7V5T5_DIOAL|nr:FAS1 domain-containing protein [Dioscorea alata]
MCSLLSLSNKTMAKAFVFVVTLTLLLSSIIPSSAINKKGQKQEEILGMVRDMQIASYFTFATLINMVQASVPSNTTFFIPDDRSLSKIIIQQNNILQFLLRHSVPSLLSFAELSHLPKGTALPSNQHPYMIKITDDNNKGIYLNNIKLISPDICKSGASFKCHGITGVFLPDAIRTPPPPKQAPEYHVQPPLPRPSPEPPVIRPSPPRAAPPAQPAPVSASPIIAPTPISSSPDEPLSSSSNMLHGAGWLLFLSIFVSLV